MIRNMIVSKELTKIFKWKKKSIVAVDHLNLHVRKGETYGLIGPTGSGKTRWRKHFYWWTWCDKGRRHCKKRLVYWRLTGRQNLEFFAKLRNLWDCKDRIEYLLKLFQLDEPLTGIDPLTAHGIKKVIKEEFKEKTIIWTSHNLYEIEEMCDRMGILNKERLILEGSPDELKKKYWNYEKVIWKLYFLFAYWINWLGLSLGNNKYNC